MSGPRLSALVRCRDEVQGVGALLDALRAQTISESMEIVVIDSGSRDGSVDEVRKRGIEPYLARRNTEHGSGLGVYRWVSERTLSWLHQFRRLRIRFDRRADIHQAFLTLAESLICLRLLPEGFC